MGRRSRVLVAVVVALLLHAGGRWLVDAIDVRVVRAIERAAPDGSRVVVTLAPSEAPPTSRAPPRVVEPRSTPRDASEPASRAPSDGAPDVAPVDGAPVDSAPVDGAPVDGAPSTPGGRSIIAQPEPRSFLERAIAGSTGLPPPNLDEFLRAPTESEAEAARRKIQAFASAAAAHGAPPVDAGSIVEQLEALDEGGYRYTTGGFVATIHADGAVTFDSKENKLGLGSSALPGRSGDLFEPYGPGIDPISPTDGSPGPRVLGVPVTMAASSLVSGSFDLTAAMLRAQGQDPYEHEKLCFLDETLGIRAELRGAHEKKQIAGLRRSLERAWFDDPGPPAERRAALFAIWDECREEELGMFARELVASFVRQHLPAGSPDAFTAQELAALNATRVSTMEFAPYG